ncbi:hypothetical protein LPW26_24250 [Rhodopseudomonas sp. HC1]|uniref:hypothetical protein n=1 Tax=Rhodopseudomonas infernalis TaxID=2897386 RepID=UPI001EE96420|nr:hypothetical protein [Rhodopseudomonas infernalis]MCG6207772.1 hypothetical protein [Rhodopseudomonas infernalis]
MADIQSSGVELKEFPGNEYGRSYIASKTSKALADQSFTLVSFGFNDKLWRVVIAGRPISDDPAGSAVLGRYKELSSLLAEKYGKPKEYHRLGESIYSQSAYFVAGIRGGNSSWYSNFETTDFSIQLGLTATDSSTSNWRLIYENKEIRKGFEASKRSREKGSL